MTPRLSLPSTTSCRRVDDYGVSFPPAVGFCGHHSASALTRLSDPHDFWGSDFLFTTFTTFGTFTTFTTFEVFDSKFRRAKIGPDKKEQIFGKKLIGFLAGTRAVPLAQIAARQPQPERPEQQPGGPAQASGAPGGASWRPEQSPSVVARVNMTDSHKFAQKRPKFAFFWPG